MSQAKRRFLKICQIRDFPFWEDVSSETLIFDKIDVANMPFCEDVSSEIAILARLEGAPGGHIGARLGLSGAFLMPLKIITARC